MIYLYNYLCTFTTAELTLILSVIEEAEEGEWTIDEATEKFQSSGEGSYWRTAFNQGVTLDENIFQDYACNKTSEEYIARHDLTYLTPCGHELRCKVRQNGS